MCAVIFFKIEGKSYYSSGPPLKTFQLAASTTIQ